LTNSEGKGRNRSGLETSDYPKKKIWPVSPAHDKKSKPFSLYSVKTVVSHVGYLATDTIDFKIKC
jgi:hypothetical protein